MDRYPRSRRPIEERGQFTSEESRKIASRFAFEYYDGDRMYGYGGYYYHPRFWQETVKRFRDHYGLDPSSQVLDVGCAKGFMLFDLKELIPGISVAGLDISAYGIENAVESIRPFLHTGDAKSLPFEDDSFDLIISINTIHNLALDDCKQALREIQRVSRKHAFITVDAWRNEQEREKFLKWNLTAKTYMHVDDWKKLFHEVGYTGDYYWFIAEEN
jgi:ubiquinone/menaquinone biosynthesis C-methylase UbiE